MLTLGGRRTDGQAILLNLLHAGVKLVLPALLSARAGTTILTSSYSSTTTTTRLLLLYYYYYYYYYY